ncbi:MAG: WecB/TagA/CpsF family glycosyltransferase [Veillonella sp.]|nr:WecB/TagA/CpsF family glycosyltransferase [Veillonella sp.]
MRKRIDILSVPIDVITKDETIQRVQEMMNEPGLHIVATANAEMVMLANSNPSLHTILANASLVVPDGAGVLWAAEQNGEHFPERVAGIDVAKGLFKVASEQSIPVYCLGAAPGVAEKAVSNIEQEVGPLNIVGIHDGFNAEEETNIIRTIEEGGAKIIFVALGIPKQEEWIQHKLSHLDGVVAMGIGGSFDVLAGNIPRAPEWMQHNRLEWLYRLYLEPKRIGRMMSIPKFMLTVIKNKR